MDLKDLIAATFATSVERQLFEIMTGSKPDPLDLGGLAASVAMALTASATGIDLGPFSTILASVTAWTYQDEDAHDTCFLTACLNPLHPGPCKGWKGNLFKVAPNAFHALEAARVEKANHARIKKIEALKAQGKPIPHKLLQPIVAKPHPHAGQTANKATGEAHAAGKAVSDAAGIVNNHPGKVTLGQAVKAVGPVEKGPKGKKPTLASKGIAFVISQPKVTDQYKLDKAAKITPEEWSGLSVEDKATIRGELAKVQKDGFGPQQKKAIELLGKLPEKGVAPGTPNTITTPKAPTLNEKVAKVKEEMTKGATLGEAIKKVTGKEPTGPQTGAGTLAQANAIKNITEAIHGPQKSTVQDVAKNVEVMKSGGKAIDQHPAFGGIVGKLASDAAKKAQDQNPGQKVPGVDVFHKDIAEHIKEGKPFLPPSIAKLSAHDEVTKAKTKVDAQEAKVKAAEAKLAEAKPPTTLSEVAKSGSHITEPTSMTPLQLSKIIHKEGSADIMVGGKRVKVGFVGDHSTAELIFVTPLGKGGGHYVVKTPDGEKITLGKGELVKVLPKAAATPEVITAPKPETIPAADKPKPLPAHVEHAIAMAKGQAVGASWSKNHLAAYQPLSAEEFHALPQDVKDKITQELHKSLDKFLDPKKKAAAQGLLDKFGAAKKADVAPKAPKIENVDFNKHLHDFSVTDAQAKQAVDSKPIVYLAVVAKELAGVGTAENPDTLGQMQKAQASAANSLAKKIQLYSTEVIEDSAAKDAMKAFKTAEQNLAYAKNVADAKQMSYNKISAKLATDTGGLSPIEKAALVKYQAYLLNGHPVPSDPATLHSLQVTADDASEHLNETLQSTAKKLSAPKADDMSPMVLTDAAKKLMGEEAVQPKINLTMAEVKNAKASADAQVNDFAAKYPPGVVTDPNVAAAKKTLELETMQLLATKASKQKLVEHLDQHHMAALGTGMDIHGNQLMSKDKKIISAHAKMISDNAAYLDTTLAQQEPKVKAAQAKFEAAAQKAEANQAPAELHALTDYDKATIGDAYQAAWSNAAIKALLYGVKTYDQKQKMKADAQYPSLTADLSDLHKLAGKLALAHAEEHTAELNVPTDPDTGAKLPGPEKKAWLAAVLHRTETEQQFNDLHKVAQARADHIRVSAGLKKRALPKADNSAVKAAAAESGYYKSGGHSGPNYGKPQAAKHFMLAKVGPKHAVVHQTASEKKLGKLAGQTSTTPKIENVAATPGPPVKLGGTDSTIWHIPAGLKKTITSDFKSMPKGKYLADPTEDIFDNLVTLAAVHSTPAKGRDVPGLELSVDQIVKTIDETHSKNLGVENGGMLHKKLTEWLATTAGKKYAETHNAPDMKIVKNLKGEVDLPAGITLEPGQKVQKVSGPGAFDDSLKDSSFKAITASQAQEKQDAWMQAQGLKISPAQKSAINAYTGNGHGSYSTFNDYLRGDGTGSADTKLSVVHIQSAMMPLQEHWLLKRGTGWPPELAKYKSNPHVLVGQTFEDPAFVSTTVAGSSGHFSGKPLQLIIEAPKGTVGAFINGISQYKGSENEYLLAAGTKFKVISVEVKGGQTFMRVRVVGGK